jgi:hypothetical protein
MLTVAPRVVGSNPIAHPISLDESINRPGNADSLGLCRLSRRESFLLSD